MKLSMILTVAGLLSTAVAAPSPEGGIIKRDDCGVSAVLTQPDGTLNNCCDCYTCNDDPYGTYSPKSFSLF